jgi:hypothetical protein
VTINIRLFPNSPYSGFHNSLTKIVIYIAKFHFSLYHKAASERLPVGRARSEALVAERGGITTAVKIRKNGRLSGDGPGGRG